MVELELVGLSEDGTLLVLADAAGDEFVVPLDGRLRAVVGGDRARTGKLETEMESAQTESALRPRDIQARIRAGEHPEAVAEVARVPVDRIMGYAVPVMAERQHIAERAQRCAVRRKHAEGPGQMLGDAVAERLRARGVDPGTCEWDAWRREDGRWTVSARYAGDGGERTGLFVYDALSRYTVADDEDARWLVGERVARTEPAQSEPAQSEPAQSEPAQSEAATREPAERRKASGRRLSAVSSEYDVSLFDDPDDPDAEDTADLTAVADALGDRRQDEDGHAERPVHPAAAAPPSGEAVLDEPAHDEPAGRPGPQRGGQQPKPEKRGRRGRGRASVPSWDEIMFGQPKG